MGQYSYTVTTKAIEESEESEQNSVFKAQRDADLHSNHQPQLFGDRIKIDRHAGFVINILIIS